MERLSFSSKFAYNATEAAIHMARYQIAAPFCKGKRVLDVACGEGYGALAIKRFGAATVEAVDSSADAINTASKLFRTAGVNYQVADAQHIDRLFKPGEFDVIVSLETIEHLPDPKRFLSALKKLAKPDAVIIISCPNDQWYYPNKEQANPFHVRKYSFDQFRELTTAVLGPNAAWGYGVPMIGFGNVTDDEVAGRDQMLGQSMMLDFTTQASAITLPQRQFSDVGSKNCSYFIGVWGGSASAMHSAALIPISMDQYANVVSWENAKRSPAVIDELEAENRKIAASMADVQAQLAAITASLEQARDEREALAEDKAILESNLARISVEAAHEQAKALALTLEYERDKGEWSKLGAKHETDFVSLLAEHTSKKQEAADAQARIENLVRDLDHGRLHWEATKARLESEYAVLASEFNASRMALTAENDEARKAWASEVASVRQAWSSEVASVRKAWLTEVEETYKAWASDVDAKQADWSREAAADRAAKAHEFETKLTTLSAALIERQQESDRYRVKAFALEKEMALLTVQVLKFRQSVDEKDIALTVQAQVHEELTGKHKRLAASQSQSDAELTELRVAHAALQSQSTAAIDTLREELAARKQEAEAYRIKSLAVGKEADLLTEQVLKLRHSLAEKEAALASQAQSNAELADQFAARYNQSDVELTELRAAHKALQSRSETELAKLHGEISSNQLDADGFRMQAFALSREREVLIQRLAELSLQNPGTLKAQFVRSGKYRLRRAGAAVKPILPAPMLALALRVARKMNL